MPRGGSWFFGRSPIQRIAGDAETLSSGHVLYGAGARVCPSLLGVSEVSGYAIGN